MHRDIFISHVEEDAPIAQALALALRNQGLTTWLYEEDGVAGVSYLTQIYEAIEFCRAFVLIASATSVHAHQVIREVEQAHERDKMIIPVRFGLSHQQFIDADPILRVACGTAVTLQASPADTADVATRIKTSITFVDSEPGETPPSTADATLRAPTPTAPVPQRRRWRFAITVGVTVASLAGAVVVVINRNAGPSVEAVRSTVHTIRVIDADTGKPLPGVGIEFEHGRTITATSDDEGEFRLEQAPTDPAVAKVALKAVGYAGQTRWLDLRESTVHIIRLRTMEKAATQSTSNAAPADVSPRPAAAAAVVPADRRDARRAAELPLAKDAAAVRSLPCSAEALSRSVDSQVATSVEFSNFRTSDVVIYWLDYDGKRQQYARLPAGTNYEQPTYLSHPWLVADAANACLAVYQPAANPGRVVIR